MTTHDTHAVDVDSPFARHSLILRKQNLSAIPIQPGTKAPGVYLHGAWGKMQRWEQYCETLPTFDKIERWSHWPYAGIAIALGPAGGIIAVDVDRDDAVGDAIIAALPPSPVRKKGERGQTLFFRYAGEKSRRKRCNGTMAVEILSVGRQTVLPGTIHPATGRAYYWLTPDTLLDYRIAELPRLPANHLALIDAVIARYETPHVRSVSIGSSMPLGVVDSDRVRSALAAVPADDYDIWLRIGMAIRTEFAGHSGFSLWDSWSRTSAKYKDGCTEARWNGFDQHGGADKVNIETVFWFAYEHGWIEPQRHYVNGGPAIPAAAVYRGGPELALELRPAKAAHRSEQHQDSAESEPQAAPRKSIVGRAMPDELVHSAPGLVGRLAEWLHDTAIYPHPALALGAALCTVGALKSHKVRLANGLRTNLLVFAVAPSSSGKAHYMRAVKALLKAAGLELIFGGKPSSDSALLKSLRNGDGRRLIPWDEVGLGLAALTGQNAGSHQAAILTTIMELFSEADSVYIGKEYADHDGRMGRHDIDQPALTVYGTTTPAALYAAFESKHAHEGFLPRWLVFETANPDPKRRAGGSVSDPPPDLIADCQAIERMPRNVAPAGNIDAAVEIRPKVVPLSPDAAELLELSLDYFDAVRREGRKEERALDAFWGRAGEHAQKLALIAHDDAAGDVITREELRWALKIVQHCTILACVELEARISDSRHEKHIKRVLGIIRAMPGITATKLLRKTYFVTAKERAEIVKTLQDGGQIVATEVRTGRAGRPTLRFTAIDDPCD